MMKEVVWSELSELDLKYLVAYLKDNWSEKVLNHFKILLNQKIKRISSNPKQFPYLNKRKRYRRCVLTKHKTIIYKEFKTHIVVLRIFDTRQNPKSKIF